MDREFTKVVVSRQWDNPNITVAVTFSDIQVSMGLTDFIHALSLEVGNPTLLLTQAQLEKRLLASAVAVQTQMQAVTAQVM